MNKKNMTEKNFKIYCVFSKEKNTFSETIKQVFREYLRSNSK